jgi:hypothetical protein
LNRFIKICTGTLLIMQLADSNANTSALIFNVLAISTYSHYLVLPHASDFLLSLPDTDPEDNCFKSVDSPSYSRSETFSVKTGEKTEIIYCSGYGYTLNKLSYFILDIPPPQVS